ncbi:hypothetical protein IF1G_09506 [Cordyceps javanica]|uniref:Uncharacterized protein n=1 Tax=Cordyceps javanica TaxID=43265 RepID=A0A545UR28_9HYPO|nr:hypothetical protein IF1G_09506 [Cordyceps javanica]
MHLYTSSTFVVARRVRRQGCRGHLAPPFMSRNCPSNCTARRYGPFFCNDNTYRLHRANLHLSAATWYMSMHTTLVTPRRGLCGRQRSAPCHDWASVSRVAEVHGQRRISGQSNYNVFALEGMGRAPRARVPLAHSHGQRNPAPLPVYEVSGHATTGYRSSRHPGFLFNLLLGGGRRRVGSSQLRIAAGFDVGGTAEQCVYTASIQNTPPAYVVHRQLAASLGTRCMPRAKTVRRTKRGV